MSTKTKKTKPGKFTLRYVRRDGFSWVSDGQLNNDRSERLLDMFSAALMGEKHVPGLSEVLDRYIADYNARVAETEAAGGRQADGGAHGQVSG